MKKKIMTKGALAGSMLLASTILSGCIGPFPPVAVYCPPPDAETPEPTFRAEDNLPAPVYGPPEFFDPDYDPEDNIPVDVYGPPSFFGMEISRKIRSKARERSRSVSSSGERKVSRLISCSSSPRPSSRIAWGVAALLNSRSVTTFTRTSVHWAERMTAISSSKGLLNFRAGFAS